MGTGGKARPGRDADHSPPSSAEVKNELYLLSPHVPQWHAAEELYFSFKDFTTDKHAFYIFSLNFLEIGLLSLYSPTLFQEMVFPSLSGMTSILFSHWLVFEC
jgi:hypothetical protein